MTPLYIFDLDGTLALIGHRRHFVEGAKKDWRSFFAACVDDKPNVPVITTMQLLSMRGAEVRVWSGRSDEVRAETVRWLDRHAGFYLSDRPDDPRLQMRKAGDHQPDEKLKRSWLDALTPHDRARLVCVFDDRDRVVRMWRLAGVACMQVAPGDF